MPGKDKMIATIEIMAMESRLPLALLYIIVHMIYNKKPIRKKASPNNQIRL
jgi:hypothetical protein